MDLRILDFHVGRRVGKQNSLVWLRRRNVYVAKVGPALGIERYPQLQAFDL